MLALMLPLTLLAAAGHPQDDGERALMREIEAAIILPRGANPLASYGRNYAREGTRIVAVFATPPVFSGGGCFMVSADLKSRPCTDEEIAGNRKAEREYAASQAAAGESRWFEDRRSLPLVFDGGCSFIDVEYDPAGKRFVSVACHGVA